LHDSIWQTHYSHRCSSEHSERPPTCAAISQLVLLIAIAASRGGLIWRHQACTRLRLPNALAGGSISTSTTPAHTAATTTEWLLLFLPRARHDRRCSASKQLHSRRAPSSVRICQWLCVLPLGAVHPSCSFVPSRDWPMAQGTNTGRPCPAET
jgi:hypothetical protein